MFTVSFPTAMSCSSAHYKDLINPKAQFKFCILHPQYHHNGTSIAHRNDLFYTLVGH